MHPSIIARYLSAPDRSTRDALEQEYPGVAAEAAKKPVEAAQAREMVALRKHTAVQSPPVVLPEAQDSVEIAKGEALTQAVNASSLWPEPGLMTMQSTGNEPEPVEPETKKKPATKDGPRKRAARSTRKPRAPSKRSPRT